MKFTWGDSVKVKDSAIQEFRPGEIGSVCGFTEICNKELSDYFNLPIGTTTYTVEYFDGSDNQIPEEFLEEHDDDEDIGIE